MALPPPLPTGQHEPAGKKTNTSSTTNKSGVSPWLIGGGILAGLLLVTAIILYFMTDLFGSDSYEYDDGNRNERVLRKHSDSDDNLIKVHKQPADSVQAASYAHALPVTLHGQGINGKGPMSLDIDIDANGSITGTYWNMFGNIEFNASGSIGTDGTLDLSLTTVKDNVNTRMTLYSTDGINYHGSWGKNNQPVDITLYEGNQPLIAYPNIQEQYHVSGVGLNADVNISEDNGTLYYWYPEQGYRNRIRMIVETTGYTLVNTRGETVATITTTDDYDTLILTDNANRTFTVTRR